MRKIGFLFFTGLLLISCGHNQAKHKENHGHHHRFDDADKWARIFEDKKRDKWQKPKEVLKAVGIKKDSLVADIGSATGYFPVKIAKIAKLGRIWGIDIEPNLVNYLNKRAQKEKLHNLFSILGTLDDPMIPEKVDFIFIVNTYHHIDKRISYFKKLQNSLSLDGKLVVIDFKKGDLPFGPKDKMKIAKNKIVEELSQAGFKLYQSPEILPYQNLLIFKVRK